MCYNGSVEECAEAFQGTFANAGVPGSTNNDNKRLLYRYLLSKEPRFISGFFVLCFKFQRSGSNFNVWALFEKLHVR